MNVIVKLAVILYLILTLLAGESLPYERILLLLVILAVMIYQERYNDSVYVSILMLLLTTAIAGMDSRFSILLALTAYDFMLKRAYWGLAISVLGIGLVPSDSSRLLDNYLIVTLCVALAYVKRKGTEEGRRFTQTMDNERRLRYELERAKAKLLHSSREIASITEVKERNRIAREIHDSIGHKIAGILIQLQAAYKLFARDKEQAMGVIQKSIEGLAHSVELLRTTVHNIKPKANLGIDYIQSIVDNYGFCPVELKLTGDFNAVPSSHLEIISTNIKEALTNSARYSFATLVEVAIDVTERYTRLYIKDNGVGAKSMKEGLGLSGMKERVRNIGGSLTISSSKGFLIVCLIPKHEGSGNLEVTHRG